MAMNFSWVPADHGGVVLQKPGRASCGEFTTAQLSRTVRPVLTPPENCPPPPKRAARVTSKPLYTWVCSPKCDFCVTRLSTCPNFAGLRSYNPHSRSLLLTSRVSVGTTKQYSS